MQITTFAVMSPIEIRKVTDKRGLRQFIRFYYDLYSGSKYAVPFLYFDEINTLRRDKNPSFECCDAAYFMAYRDGKPVGRVAAIINRRANERWNRRLVRFGWFDFIDDMKYSDMSQLLDTSEGSLKASYHIAVKKITEFFKRRD